MKESLEKCQQPAKPALQTYLRGLLWRGLSGGIYEVVSSYTGVVSGGPTDIEMCSCYRTVSVIVSTSARILIPLYGFAPSRIIEGSYRHRCRVERSETFRA